MPTTHAMLEAEIASLRAELSENKKLSTQLFEELHQEKAYLRGTTSRDAETIARLREALKMIIKADTRHEWNNTSQDTGYDGPAGKIARAALAHLPQEEPSP